MKDSRVASQKWMRTDLIDGGAPAGINILPGDEGCRTTRIRIRITTRHGKRRTNPSGIDIEEFRFSRILLRKNDNLGTNRPFSREMSSRVGRFGEEGIRFEIFCISPIDAVVLWLSRQELELSGQSRSRRRAIVDSRGRKCRLSVVRS
jgi:hypothetical protein